MDLDGPLFADADRSLSCDRLPSARRWLHYLFRNFDLQKQKAKLMELRSIPPGRKVSRCRQARSMPSKWSFPPQTVVRPNPPFGSPKIRARQWRCVGEIAEVAGATLTVELLP